MGKKNLSDMTRLARAACLVAACLSTAARAWPQMQHTAEASTVAALDGALALHPACLVVFSCGGNSLSCRRMAADAAHVATLAPSGCAVLRATGHLAASLSAGQPLACLYRNTRRAVCFEHGASSWEMERTLRVYLGREKPAVQ